MGIGAPFREKSTEHSYMGGSDVIICNCVEAAIIIYYCFIFFSFCYLEGYCQSNIRIFFRFVFFINNSNFRIAPKLFSKI